MQPLDKHDVEILIVDDGQSKEYEADCGMDWTSAEAVALADRQIKARVGDRVQLKHLALSEAVGSLNPELQQGIMNGIYPLPLLIINGEREFPGHLIFACCWMLLRL